MACHQPNPYEGEEKYIFVSYSHKDNDQVLPLIEKLSSRGYRIWYDERIIPGCEWTEEIAEHIKASAMVLFCVSPNFAVSKHCRRELNYAASEDKPFLYVVLERTKLSPGMKMQLEDHQGVYRYQCDTEEKFIAKICAHPEMHHCNPRLDTSEATEEPETEVSVTPLVKDTAQMQSDTDSAQTLHKQHIRDQVSRYGKIINSVTSGVGALILIAVTALLFAGYHQENLLNYTSFGPFPNWLVDILPSVWHELPEISSPDYRDLRNLPILVWLVAVGWFLKSVGCTFKQYTVTQKLMDIAAVLRYTTIAAHIALCARMENALQQGGPQGEIWLTYYFPVENLVAFFAMVLGGCVVGWTANRILRKVLSLVYEVEL